MKTAICLKCGKEFTYRPAGADRKYCSRECGRSNQGRQPEWRKQKEVGYKEPRPKVLCTKDVGPRTCEICGKVFQGTGQWAAKPQRLCSVECSQIRNRRFFEKLKKRDTARDEYKQKHPF